MKYINVQYPFRDSHKGFFLDLNSDDQNAIKSDLMHLILTRRGQRLYNPQFGTNLIKFIFEPEDGMTLLGIKSEITDVVKRYLPMLSIKEIIVEESDESEHAAVIRIDYNITDDMFSMSDFVIIKL